MTTKTEKPKSFATKTEKPKNRSKNSQNRKTENPNAPLDKVSVYNFFADLPIVKQNSFFKSL